jgi:hypothetical protein
MLLQASLLGTWFFREQTGVDYRWWYVAEVAVTSLMLVLSGLWINSTQRQTDARVQELKQQLGKEREAEEVNEVIGRALEEQRRRIRSTIEVLKRLSPERIALGGTSQELELQNRLHLLDATSDLRGFIHAHQKLRAQEQTPLMFEAGAELGQLRQLLIYVKDWLKASTAGSWDGRAEMGLNELNALNMVVAERMVEAHEEEEASGWSTESIAARLNELEFKISLVYTQLSARRDIPEKLVVLYNRSYFECLQILKAVRLDIENSNAPLSANVWLGYYRAALVRVSETLNRFRIEINRAAQIQSIRGDSNLFSILSELVKTALALIEETPLSSEDQTPWVSRSIVLSRAVANTKANIVLAKQNGSEKERNGRWTYQLSIKVTISVSLIFCLSWFSQWQLLPQSSQEPCCPEITVNYPPPTAVSDTCCSELNIKLDKLFDYVDNREFKPKVNATIDLSGGTGKPKLPKACAKGDLCKAIDDLNARLDSVLLARHQVTQ